MITAAGARPADSLAIRMLEDEPASATLATLAQLMTDAYPVMRVDSTEKLATFIGSLARSARDAGARWVVAESAHDLAGCMRLYDFTMNVRDADAFTGGVGSVAVALTHKRRGIARAMLAWYLQHYRARGAAFAVLHPFRPDFYRSIGFGYGTPVHRYRFAPGTLRAEGRRGTVRALGSADVDALIACSERVRVTTNGLIAKHRAPTERALGEHNVRYVGVYEADELRAFMQTSIALGETGRTNQNALVVRELHAENDAAFAALLGYLHAQRDQFAAVTFESSTDDLYLAADDPRDGSDVVVTPPATHRIAETGLGIMYRLLDVPKAFDYVTAAGDSFALRVEVEDGFFEPTAGAWTFRFTPHERVRVEARAVPDATLRIGSADLASLLVGSLGLRSLVRHRLATLAPSSMLAQVDRAFRADAAPICHTRF